MWFCLRDSEKVGISTSIFCLQLCSNNSHVLSELFSVLYLVCYDSHICWYRQPNKRFLGNFCHIRSQTGNSKWIPDHLAYWSENWMTKSLFKLSLGRNPGLPIVKRLLTTKHKVDSISLFEPSLLNVNTSWNCSWTWSSNSRESTCVMQEHLILFENKTTQHLVCLRKTTTYFM